MDEKPSLDERVKSPLKEANSPVPAAILPASPAPLAQPPDPPAAKDPPPPLAPPVEPKAEPDPAKSPIKSVVEDVKENTADPIAERRAAVEEHCRRSPDFLSTDIVDGFALVSFRSKEELVEFSSAEAAAVAAAAALVAGELERAAAAEEEERLAALPPPPNPPPRPTPKRPQHRKTHAHEIGGGADGGKHATPNGMAVKRPADDLALPAPFKQPKLELADRDSHSVPQSMLSPTKSLGGSPAVGTPAESRLAGTDAERKRSLAGSTDAATPQKKMGAPGTSAAPGFAFPQHLNPFLNPGALAGLNPAALAGLNPAFLGQAGMIPGFQNALLASLAQQAGHPLSALLAQQAQQPHSALSAPSKPPQPTAPPPPQQSSASASTSHSSAATLHPSTASTSKKSGKWCAMHVKIAWDIYNKESAKKKQQKAAAAASTSKEQPGPAKETPPHNGTSVITSSGPSPQTQPPRKSLDGTKSSTPGSGSRSESRRSIVNGDGLHPPSLPPTSAAAAHAQLRGPPLPGAFPFFDPATSVAAMSAYQQLHLGLPPTSLHLPPSISSLLPPSSMSSNGGGGLRLAPEFQGLRLPPPPVSSYDGSHGMPTIGGMPLPPGLLPHSFNPMDPYAMMAARQRQMDMMSLSHSMRERDELLRRQQHAALLSARHAATSHAAGFPGMQHGYEGAGALSGLLEQELMARQRLHSSGFPSTAGLLPPHSFPGLLPSASAQPPVSQATLDALLAASAGALNGKLPQQPRQSFSSTLEQLARQKRDGPPTNGAPLPPPPSSLNR